MYNNSGVLLEMLFSAMRSKIEMPSDRAADNDRELVLDAISSAPEAIEAEEAFANLRHNTEETALRVGFMAGFKAARELLTGIAV